MNWLQEALLSVFSTRKQPCFGRFHLKRNHLFDTQTSPYSTWRCFFCCCCCFASLRFSSLKGYFPISLNLNATIFLWWGISIWIHQWRSLTNGGWCSQPIPWNSAAPLVAFLLGEHIYIFETKQPSSCTVCWQARVSEFEVAGARHAQAICSPPLCRSWTATIDFMH